MDRKIIVNYVDESKRTSKHVLHLIFNKDLTLEQDIYCLIYFPSLILICDLCERRINTATSILLITKPPPNQRVDLCVNCFAKKEINNYRYYVRSALNLTITEQKWPILSEVHLLEGLSKFGFGNWNQIQEYMQYNQAYYTKQEIIAHYDHFYLVDHRLPVFADYSIGTQKTYLSLYDQKATDQKANHMQPTYSKLEEQEQMLYYCSKRDEFYVEYDSTAQDLIANLEFNPSDTEEEQQFKFILLESYNARIKQRNLIKSFVKEHRIFQKQEIKKHLYDTAITKDTYAQLIPFFKFNSYQEITQLIQEKAKHTKYVMFTYGLTDIKRKLAKLDKEKKIRLSTVNAYLEEKLCQRSLEVSSCHLKRMRFQFSTDDEDSPLENNIQPRRNYSQFSEFKRKRECSEDRFQMEEFKEIQKKMKQINMCGEHLKITILKNN